MDLTDITAITTAVTSLVTSLGIWTFVLAGAIFGLAGRAIMSAKKGSR